MPQGTPWSLELPLIADPDATEELGSSDAELIADEDLRGSRLLVIGKTVQAIDIGKTRGGLIEFSCTFHPAPGTRFTWARVQIRLKKPDGTKIIDLAPREIRESEPVKITVDGTGKLGVKYGFLELGTEEHASKEFAIYHCGVQGSGEQTALARWDISENPHRRDGLGADQLLAFTVPVAGLVTAELLITARLAKHGLAGALDAVRDMVLGSEQRRHILEFDIQ